MDKLREELERVQVKKTGFVLQIIIDSLAQGAAGKYQIAQEKTQLELDKAHQEIDILREKMERNTGESRRVSFNQRRRSTSLWFWIGRDGHRWSWMIIGDHMMDQSKTLPWPHNYTYLAFFSIIYCRHIVITI